MQATTQDETFIGKWFYESGGFRCSFQITRTELGALAFKQDSTMYGQLYGALCLNDEVWLWTRLTNGSIRLRLHESSGECTIVLQFRPDGKDWNKEMIAKRLYKDEALVGKWFYEERGHMWSYEISRTEAGALAFTQQSLTYGELHGILELEGGWLTTTLANGTVRLKLDESLGKPCVVAQFQPHGKVHKRETIAKRYEDLEQRWHEQQMYQSFHFQWGMWNTPEHEHNYFSTVPVPGTPPKVRQDPHSDHNLAAAVA